MILQSMNKTMNELASLLGLLSDEEYSRKCPALNNATIGEHARHIIEMLDCLSKNYDSGVVDYDNRPRNAAMQSDTKFAVGAIISLLQNLDKSDKEIVLVQSINGQITRIASNYNRELLYNLEHCIHHQALIKVALRDYNHISVDEHFGIAPSTIEYRTQCAQ